MIVWFIRKQELAPGVWRYDFETEQAFEYVPGQYIDLHLPQVTDDPRGQSRTFSLISLPGEPVISFVSRFDATGRHSLYKEILHHLPAQAAGHIDDAMGDVILPKLASVPLVWVAGGIGMASFVSMLKHLKMKSEERNISLFYALRNEADDAFSTLIDDFTFSYAKRFIKPERMAVTDILAQTNSDSLIYLSGSQNFVESLRNQLMQSGVENSRIIFDFFDGYADL